jgi:hypothetical protein
LSAIEDVKHVKKAESELLKLTLQRRKKLTESGVFSALSEILDDADKQIGIENYGDIMH